MSEPLYTLKPRRKNWTTFLSVETNRAGLTATTPEKVLPPIVEYDQTGMVNVLSPADIVQGVKQHPYIANSPQFSEERLADVEVSNLYSALENFPVLLPATPSSIDDEKLIPHPVAELIYTHMIYFRPTEEFQDKIKKLGYIEKSRVLAEVLETVQSDLLTKHNVSIDLHSVPKRKVGTFAFQADSEGFSIPAKTFSFGFHRAIPSERIGRELSSLKAAERFANPTSLPFDIQEELKPYITMVRVAIVATKTAMMDGVDLFESGIPKVACRLVRENLVKDVSSIPIEERKVVFRPFKAGVEAVHRERSLMDETVDFPGPMRFVFPAGVKVAAQPLKGYQMVDAKGKPIDVMMDFRTVAAKGALALFAMMDPDNYSKGMNQADCLLHLQNMKIQPVYIQGVEYQAYVGELPVMRPGQRHTELCRPSNSISFDIISKAILGIPYKISQRLESEYKELVEFRQALLNQLEIK